MRGVAVTGAAGLIGAAVCRRLAGRGTPVYGLDDFSIGVWSGEGVPLRHVDVAAEDVTAALDELRPEAVVHAAAHPGGRSLQEPVLDVRVNALGSMRVFDWCARHGAHVVYLSSSVIYGAGGDGPIGEDAPLAPGTIYGVCKVACEQALPVLEVGYGLSWTVLRLFATYGAGHRPGTHQGIVNVMLSQMLEGDRVIVRGSLDRIRDLLYVEDAAEAIVAALDRPAARGRTLNVGTGEGITVRSLIDRIAQALGRPASSLEVIEREGTPGDPWSSVADISAAAATLDYRPRHSLDQGLAAVVRQRLSHTPAGA